MINGLKAFLFSWDELILHRNDFSKELSIFLCITTILHRYIDTMVFVKTSIKDFLKKIYQCTFTLLAGKKPSILSLS